MLHNYKTFSLDRDSHMFIQQWIKRRTFGRKNTVKKRDLKYFEKEAMVAVKYVEGVKPMHIAQ